MSKSVVGQHFLNKSVWMSKIIQKFVDKDNYSDNICDSAIFCIARSVNQPDALFLCGSWASCILKFLKRNVSVIYNTCWHCQAIHEILVRIGNHDVHVRVCASFDQHKSFNMSHTRKVNVVYEYTALLNWKLGLYRLKRHSTKNQP